jgi:hypothetical protein
MDISAKYKPFRNKVAQLAVDDALGVVWAYSQLLQIENFKPPLEIEIAPFYLHAKPRQSYLAEWDVEVLAKEIVINCGYVASKGRTLRKWKTLADVAKRMKKFEQDIYAEFGNPGNVLVELIRVLHRQIIWQTNSPNSKSIIRYYKIFNRPGIDALCIEKFGLTLWQLYMCGIATMGFYLDKPALVASFKSEIKALTPEIIEKFLSLASLPLPELRKLLKTEQQFNERFAYAYNSLRRYPLIRMRYQEQDTIVCPLPTLVYWKFTSGLYYELISDPRFGEEFGDGF